TLVPTAFGMPQAVPVLGAGRLASRLLVPRNAVAPEWLATRTAAVEALTAWRAFDLGEPLELQLEGGVRAVVTAPAALARTRYGSFLATTDAIQIEPGIMPLAAVTTVVHEWLHLLLEHARVEGASPTGLRESAWGLRVLEVDPWLGEGAAEWGTDVVLAPARRMTPLFALFESEKRLGLRRRAPDDPHVLGYGLVRALADRMASHAALRELMVRSLHDPAAMARAAGFAGEAVSRFHRPATLAIIPEYVFTPDDGVADGLVRRLHLPVRLEALP
ncbi:MAG TPA: hypothetical protein VFX50_10565, partial [Gemmatimonadales bacterium]|nr:hypothetical protein [Gemmatimonadales bacterium]